MTEYPISAAASSPDSALTQPWRSVRRVRHEHPCVLFTRVNGEHSYDAAKVIAVLDEGHAVALRRQPDNAFDRRAIELLTADGRKLGYVARTGNSAVARRPISHGWTGQR